MHLKLRALSRIRFLTEVISHRGVSQLVPTVESIAVGTRVAIDVEFPDGKPQLAVAGVVIGVQPLAGRTPAGVLVRLDDASVRQCESIVTGKEAVDPATRRTEPRSDCSFAARIVSPKEVSNCEIKSLSTGGAALKAPPGTQFERTLKASVLLSDGEDALFTAEVVWSRPELGLCGLKFMSLDPRTARRLRTAVDALLSEVPTAASASVRSARVVAADDDATVLGFLARVLSNEGCQVIKASRGDDALEAVKRERPNLVFLDVLMPGKDGLEVCKDLRADPAFAKYPIVLLSAMAEDRLIDAARESGASDFLTKPLRVDGIRRVLTKFL
jgi:CheY-like chemotaxis protein